MNNGHLTQKGSNRIEHYDDEIELMDYILVMWKWKYLILAGTFAFALVVAIISFIAWKQQPTMYRTSIVLKPGVLEIDETGNKVFIDSPEKIKALIKNEIEKIVPPLVADGGYIPLADGRVREDVPFDNYLYYRKLISQFTQV